MHYSNGREAQAGDQISKTLAAIRLATQNVADSVEACREKDALWEVRVNSHKHVLVHLDTLRDEANELAKIFRARLRRIDRLQTEIGGVLGDGGDSEG